jgi:hypothetical protein
MGQPRLGVSLIELREGGERRAQGEKEEGSQVVAVLLLVEIVQHKQGDDLLTPVGVLPKRVVGRAQLPSDDGYDAQDLCLPCYADITVPQLRRPNDAPFSQHRPSMREQLFSITVARSLTTRALSP